MICHDKFKTDKRFILDIQDEQLSTSVTMMDQFVRYTENNFVSVVEKAHCRTLTLDSRT